MVGGLYFLALLQSPNIILDDSNSVRSKEESLVANNDDFIKIEKLKLVVPLERESNEAYRIDEVNWKRPEEGNPTEGGRFVLCASRFGLGLTPQQTKSKSPFYHIEKLNRDDKIQVHFQNKWYSYNITDAQANIDVNAFFEQSPDEASMAIFTCSKDGKKMDILPFLRS